MSNQEVGGTHVAFSKRVKAMQTRMGSRAMYAEVDDSGSWYRPIDGSLRDFIQRKTTMVFATASADGQPYVQHRGGPPGFLHVLDEQTIAFADFEGNRQYISRGNIEENPRAQFLLVEYATRTRVKIWGPARP